MVCEATLSGSSSSSKRTRDVEKGGREDSIIRVIVPKKITKFAGLPSSRTGARQDQRAQTEKRDWIG